MPSSHLVLCHPLLLLSPIPPIIRVFSNESALRMRWPKYWSFSFSISSSNEHSGLIFRMDWLDLLAVQESLKSLLQHHSSKASILQHSAFFTVQLSHPYMTTGKTIALTRRTFPEHIARPRGATPCLRSGAEAGRIPCPRGRGQEELSHARGQGQQPGGATPRPRSCGCTGAGGPRGAIPRSRSGGAAVRRYPSSKVRETQIRQ